MLPEGDVHEYRFTAFDDAGTLVFDDSLKAACLDDATDLARIWFTMGMDRARATLERDGEVVARFERDRPRRSGGLSSPKTSLAIGPGLSR